MSRSPYSWLDDIFPYPNIHNRVLVSRSLARESKQQITYIHTYQVSIAKTNHSQFVTSHVCVNPNHLSNSRSTVCAIRPCQLHRLPGTGFMVLILRIFHVSSKYLLRQLALLVLHTMWFTLPWLHYYGLSLLEYLGLGTISRNSHMQCSTFLSTQWCTRNNS